MLPSLRRLFPAALLLTASVALADSPMPGADVPVQELVTRTPVETRQADEQLRVLSREVQSLETDVQQLQATVAVRGAHDVELLDQTNHSLWP